MPTKLERFSINVPPDLAALLKRDSAIFRMPIATRVIGIIAQHYEGLEKQADLFRDQSLKTRQDIPVFETPQPSDAQSTGSRRTVGQGKT
jgi:hypothetical protein